MPAAAGSTATQHTHQEVAHEDVEKIVKITHNRQIRRTLGIKQMSSVGSELSTRYQNVVREQLVDNILIKYEAQ